MAIFNDSDPFNGIDVMEKDGKYHFSGDSETTFMCKPLHKKMLKKGYHPEFINMKVGLTLDHIESVYETEYHIPCIAMLMGKAFYLPTGIGRQVAVVYLRTGWSNIPDDEQEETNPLARISPIEDMLNLHRQVEVKMHDDALERAEELNIHAIDGGMPLNTIDIERRRKRLGGDFRPKGYRSHLRLVK